MVKNYELTKRNKSSVKRKETFKYHTKINVSLHKNITR